MKLFSLLPLALCVATRAIPTPSLLGHTGGSPLKQVRAELNSLGLSLNSPVSTVVNDLGLNPTIDSLASLLTGLVGGADTLLNEVEGALSGLLGSLGLGGVSSTISEAEGALGLSSDATIRSLLGSLGVLQG